MIGRSLWLLFICTFAAAHQPLWNAGSKTAEEAFIIEEIAVSKAIFGQFEASGAAYFQLDAPAGFALNIALFSGGGCATEFEPEFWLLSPTANASSSSGVPPGYQAEQYLSDWQAYRGHGLTGRKGPSIIQNLSEGRYYLLVRAQSPGFYMLSLAGAEVPGGTAAGRAAIARFNACE